VEEDSAMNFPFGIKEANGIERVKNNCWVHNYEGKLDYLN